MKVNLKRTWYGPTKAVPASQDKKCPLFVSGKRYRVSGNPHTFPESYRAILPKDAVILDDQPAKTEKIVDPRVGEEAESLTKYDLSRAAGDAEAKAVAEAEERAPVVPRRRQSS